MKRLLKIFSALICVCCALVMFSACGQNIENVKFISAKYSGVLESRIYPDLTNAIELEQTYKKWNIGVGKAITVTGIRFDIVVQPTAPRDMYISVSKVDKDKSQQLTQKVSVLFVSEVGGVNIIFDKPIEFTAGDESTLEVTFYDGAEENNNIKFKISNFSLKTR